ncbi:Histone acetyltransferase SAGA/ADA, catalytic subunit PCAF/GCN5 [Pseudoloma neurophilia]|uniref:histone acetyltransferase n=1 Tax=Pseudoloma neurophilia TaxID=146866 RepID=A0A0R0LWB0_9MICR|nr:Histone acetyltransferase SAGA/ADA, catalytic subunit PCAF/GCN5 [Pseudoloma neurophilia]
MEDTEQKVEQNTKEMREKMLIDLFKVGRIKFKLVSTSKGWSHSTREDILNFKAILQKQLPKMPKEYIFKVIFNEKHKNIICLLDEKIIGGVCYRPFYEMNFIEIVFLAVDAEVQVSGHGSMIIDMLKEHIKREIQDIEPNFLDYLGYPTKMKNPIYILTYADNYAIGFFKKQGFGTEIRFKNWQGYIKDYEGGTLVQCKVLWEINYLKKMELLEKKRIEFIMKMDGKSTFNILRDPVDFKHLKSVWDIPGLKEAHFKEDMFISSDKKLKNVLQYILSDIRTDRHAWPFLLPVNEKEVLDYYQIIKEPMDLSTIEKNIENNQYNSLQEFEFDFRKIFKNCYTYNAPTTTYCKCASILEKKFDNKLNEVRHVLENRTRLSIGIEKKSQDRKVNIEKKKTVEIKQKEKNNTTSAQNAQPQKRESVHKKKQPSTFVVFQPDGHVDTTKLNISQSFGTKPVQTSQQTKKKEKFRDEKKTSDEEDDIFNLDMMNGNSGDFF